MNLSEGKILPDPIEDEKALEIETEVDRHASEII